MENIEPLKIEDLKGVIDRVQLLTESVGLMTININKIKLILELHSTIIKNLASEELNL